MAQWTLSRNEGRLISALRDLEAKHHEFTLSISGFMRSGKRMLVLEPKPRIYLDPPQPVSLAVDD